MPRLCAFGCVPSSGVPMHRFPNLNKVPELFKTWVTLVGGKLNEPSDYEYYKKKRICDIHFTERDRNRNNRLNAEAVPTLHLPEQFVSPGLLEQEQPVTSGQDSQHATASHSSGTGQFGSPVVSEQEQCSSDNLKPQTNSTNIKHTATQPAFTDTSKDLSAAGKHVRLEHNYDVTSKPMKNSAKGAGKFKPMYNLVQPMYTKIKRLRSEISRLRKKNQSFKARLRSAEMCSESATFQDVVRNMTKPAQLFVHMQLQTSKKPKGRRFNLEEKVLSLSLYKKSPKSYVLLSKYFTLPSAKAMKRLLSQIKLTPGINPIIFDKIKKTVAEQPLCDRLSSLIFDEMSLCPQVFYNIHKDVIEGFTTDCEKKFADHVLVFMVKGIKMNFKQPIAYYFTNGLTKLELKQLIKTVIKHAQDAGLIILNTVCDQSTVNVGAITELVNDSKALYLRNGKEWRHDLIRLNGQNIIPIYDAPHLIKGMRNNLLNKDLTYTVNNEEKIVKWAYFQQVYAADKSFGELRLLHKLTEEHVNPEKINKMRVKSATQIFSHSVAVATEHLTARGDLPAECRDLIDITLLLDNVFDSLNVNTLHIPNGKEYKGPIKKRSPHHQLWKNAKQILKTVKFRKIQTIGNKTRLTESTVPSVTNLIKTIEGMEAIWKVLSEKYGLDAFLTRNLNQDPVENFFGNIRSYGARNNAPNSLAFESAFKALLLNNYNSPHSNRANCEEDVNKCLQTLEFFVTEKVPALNANDSKEDEEIHFNERVFTESHETDAGQSNYVCGWVLTKCLKHVVKSCKQCRQDLIDSGSNKNNDYIRAKEYKNKKWLCYPSESLERSFHELQNLIVAFMKKDVQLKNIKKNIKALAEILIEYPFQCPLHKEQLIQFFNDVTINLIICSWCRSVNRVLSGKILYDGDDQIKTAAQKYYNKHKHYKNKK